MFTISKAVLLAGMVNLNKDEIEFRTNQSLAVQFSSLMEDVPIFLYLSHQI